ncbi:MAG TPA: hypothetical protein VGN32_05415, partial [Ktedonobacterales bacterium]|nr:hypothetical protein [Ktedonobacterales bacterium]
MARGKRRKPARQDGATFVPPEERDPGMLRLPARSAVEAAGAAETRPALDPEPDESAEPPARTTTGRYPVPLAPASGARLPALGDPYATRAIVIPGSGRALGRGFIRARRRPLPMQLALLVLIVGIVGSALVSVAPLPDAGANAPSTTPFEGISNAVVWHASPGYTWYTATGGDTVEAIAQRFHCQIGGLYEMNGLLAGQEVEVGKAYKIPTDAYYGLYYRPPSYVLTGSPYGQTIYTDHIWSTDAGIPPPGAYCGPTPRGSGDNLYSYDLASFDLKSPNWGAYWVRGFTWYHFGVDLANPLGTPIHAAQSGEVIFANWDTGGGGW